MILFIIKDETVDLRNKTYRDLSIEFPEIKTAFENYILDIVYIKTNEQDRIEELFLRLNEGVPLNNAEKRNAINTELIRKLKGITLCDVFFQDRLPFENKRFEFEDLMLKLVYFEWNNNFISFTKRNLDNFVDNHRGIDRLLESTINSVERTISLLNDVFETKDNLLKSKSNIPIYYWFIRNTQDVDLHNHSRFLISFNELRKHGRKP